jgi:hypothetical protein
MTLSSCVSVQLMFTEIRYEAESRRNAPALGPPASAGHGPTAGLLPKAIVERP